MKNILNQKFGRLTVIEKLGSDKHQEQLWKCRCDCGQEVIVNTISLTSGNTKSCGCYKTELIQKLNYKHGQSHTRLYYVWQAMIRRCYKENEQSYKNYGARGIKVCNKWKKDYKEFYNWAMQNGYKEGLSIERINNNRNYEPNNCKWATSKEQSYNTRRNQYIEYNSEKITITEACKKTKIPLTNVYSKARRKQLTLQEAFDSYLN